MKLNSFVKGILVTVGLYAALIVLFGAVTLFGMVEVNINGILFEESSSNILPSSIQYMYIFFIFVGVVLYYTSSAEKIEETIRPMANFVFNPEKNTLILHEIVGD